MQSDLAMQSRLAVPLDEWCGYCGLHLATIETTGAPCCESCAAEFERLEQEEAAMASPNRKARRAAQRAAKKKGRGWTR